MTNHQKMIYLQKYMDMNAKAEKKLQERERVKSLAENCTTLLSFVPRGAGDKTSIYVRLVEIEQELDRIIDGCIDTRNEITNAINSVQDSKLKELLTCRYIYGWKWEQVAERINKTVDMTRKRMHYNALSELKIQ